LRRRVGCGQERSHCCNRRYDREEEAYFHLRNYMESRRRSNKNNRRLIEFRRASSADYKLFVILPLVFPGKANVGAGSASYYLKPTKRAVMSRAEHGIQRCRSPKFCPVVISTTYSVAVHRRNAIAPSNDQCY
jgi:hypothetical protein